jgi:hypothetical protein
MRKTREILRQKWLLKRPHRAIRESVGTSIGAVCLPLSRAAEADSRRLHLWSGAPRRAPSPVRRSSRRLSGVVDSRRLHIIFPNNSRSLRTGSPS